MNACTTSMMLLGRLCDSCSSHSMGFQKLNSNTYYCRNKYSHNLNLATTSNIILHKHLYEKLS